MNRLSTRLYIGLTILLVLTSQAVYAERDREILRLGRGKATSLDWRPDGKVLAVGSATGVWFYDENLKPVGHLEVGNTYQIAWSCSGEKLAVVNADANKTLEVWQISEDTTKQKQIWTQSWMDHQWSPIQITWEPNSQRLVTGSEDDFARLWETDSGKLITKLPVKGSYVAWSPDGSKIAVSDNTVEIIDANSLKIVDSINQFSANGKVSWNSDGTLLATNCNDTDKFTDFEGECIWDTKSYKLVYSQELARIAWSLNASKFAFFGTSGFDSDVTWFEIHNSLNTEASDKTAYSAFFTDVEWQPNKETVIALADNGTLVSYDVSTKKFTNTLTLFTNAAEKLVWSPNSKFLISTQNETDQLIWELPQSQKFVANPLRTLDGQIGTYGPRTADIVWLDNLTFWSIAQAGDWEGRVAIYLDKYNVKTGENGDYSPRIYTNCWFDFNSDLSEAACLQPDKKELQIWDIKAQTVSSTIPTGAYTQFYWSPDSKMIASLSSNADEMSTTIEIWGVNDKKRISELKFYGSAIKNFSWSFDSQKFAFELTTASAYGMVNSVQLYNVADTNNNHVIDLPNVSDDVISLRWSHNGQKLFLESLQAIDIYQTGDLSKIGELKHPPTKISNLSTDDKLLALGMDDGAIRIWDVADLMAN